MKLLNYFKKVVDTHFTFWDISLLKTYGAIPGLILGAYFPEFVFKYLWLFVAIFSVLLVRYSYLMFVKPNIGKKEHSVNPKTAP